MLEGTLTLVKVLSDFIDCGCTLLPGSILSKCDITIGSDVRRNLDQSSSNSINCGCTFSSHSKQETKKDSKTVIKSYVIEVADFGFGTNKTTSGCTSKNILSAKNKLDKVNKK